jgi:hypothetical protein
MAEYRLTDDERVVVRIADQAFIPNDVNNRDWVEYQRWLADGGTPDPAPPSEKGDAP